MKNILTQVISQLPKLKTHIQLAGFAITIGAVLTVRSLLPSALNAQITAGAIGVSF
jgi:hypothetical protein